MDWNDWYKNYDSRPGLQARLQIVRAQIAAALNDCPPGPLRVVSVCAGDGRDLIGALQDHPRRNDVSAVLLDNHAESIARGKSSADQTGLGRQLRFIEADATLAKNYAGAVPVDLVILSGFLGHLRHEDVPGLINSLPMFCKTGGWAIWNRHLVLHKGREQVPAIRELFRKAKFDEVDFSTTDRDGFAVGRVQFTGQPVTLDESRVLFEFVGLDRLLGVSLPTAADSSGPKLNLIGATETDKDATDAIAASAETTIPARFEQMVALHPSRTALGSGAWQPNYEELNDTTNHLAHTIISRGGAPGDRVALLLRHDGPLIASALATLKAGRVVVVLNPTDPPERLKQILQDAEPGVILTDSTNHELAKAIAQPPQQILCFERQTAGQATSPKIKVAPEDLAWLVYTSGSTGRPKGVMQTHRNIVHNVLRLSRGISARAGDRIILLGSPSGGQGLSTTWCALLNGAALCPFPAAERGVTGLKEWMVEHKISVYVSSTSVFRHFAKGLGEAEVLPDVRMVRFGSEAATANDFATWQKHFTKECVLLNSYSSSETANVTQRRFIHEDNVGNGRLSVGLPAAGMEVLLLDENGQEVREGDVGEIVVRSRHLSPGYWRNESLTAERFFQGNGTTDFRVFRTGDFGRRAADGELMFMDRRDDRVKVQGYRIELSEIEEALARQAEVERAVVSARATQTGDNQLIAHVVLRAGQTVTTDSLRRTLRATLPGYMVPASFVFLDEFPLTPHGKIDRQALLQLQPRETQIRTQNYLKPRDIVERNLAKIWESVLGVSPVGRRDDFFDLGGTSLQSVEAMVAIEEIFNVALPPSTLVEHSTIEKLAPLLSEHAVISSPSPLVTLRAEGTGRPLFFIHSGQGDVVTYGLLMRRLPGRPIYGLQAVGVQGESWPLMSVPEMAERYLPEIIAKDPTGPYLLAGTCMGGMVAFELARRLVQMGRTVNLVALLDSPTSPYSGRRALWHEAVIDPLRDTLRMLRWGIFRVCGIKPDVRRLPSYRRFVAGMTGRANRRYRPSYYPGTVTLFLTTDTEFPAGDRRRVISQFAKETRSFTISGARPGLFVRPAVDELAGHLQACLESAEKNSPEFNSALCPPSRPTP